MSYAIIRNEKYQRDTLKGIYRHNERKNTNYSNKNIDKIINSIEKGNNSCIEPQEQIKIKNINTKWKKWKYKRVWIYQTNRYIPHSFIAKKY